MAASANPMPDLLDRMQRRYTSGTHVRLSDDRHIDDDLMHRLQEGEAQVLAQLFERYQVQLFRFYCRMTGDRAASEDLVQDVFFRILKYRHTYRGEGQFTGWMYHIARNAHLDYVRKRNQEVELLDEHAPAVREDGELEARQERELLQRALQMLPADKREVLVMSRFQDLDYEEIGHVLGCEPGAVKVRVCRAVKELRQIFFRITGRKP